MKILAFSDVHGNKAVLKTILTKAKNCDLMICAGDISIFSLNLKDIISKFKIAKKPLIIIPGNHESPQELEKIRFEFLINLHKKVYRINNILFIGYGTGGFSIRDKEFESFIKKVKKHVKKEDKIVLITHGPPYGTRLDELLYFGHVGNKSYTKAILFIKPFLYISGHLHENFNKKDKINKTFLINPGPEGRIINV